MEGETMSAWSLRGSRDSLPSPPVAVGSTTNVPEVDREKILKLSSRASERRVSEIRIQISDGLYRGVVPHTAK